MLRSVFYQQLICLLSVHIPQIPKQSQVRVIANETKLPNFKNTTPLRLSLFIFKWILDIKFLAKVNFALHSNFSAPIVPNGLPKGNYFGQFPALGECQLHWRVDFELESGLFEAFNFFHYFVGQGWLKSRIYIFVISLPDGLDKTIINSIKFAIKISAKKGLNSCYGDEPTRFGAIAGGERDRKQLGQFFRAHSQSFAWI